MRKPRSSNRAPQPGSLVMTLPRSLLCLFASLVVALSSARAQSPADAPLRIAIVGATHAHLGFLLGRHNKTDVTLTGIYEPNAALSKRIAERYHLADSLFYTDLNKMLDSTKPEAAVAFGSVWEHLAAVEACAPRGIHVMVEKPLAVNLEHAARMEQLARQYHIQLLTDYETSWYPTTAKTHELVNDGNYVGAIRRLVAHDGHQGPKALGVSAEFLDWLTDPVQNGGGALVDFGCYGANLMTWLMKGQPPVSVTAVTQHFQPAVYPKVDDDATIIVSYPSAVGVIQASWNWPFNRKDLEVYGDSGYVITQDATRMRVRNASSRNEEAMEVTVGDVPVYVDPFTYFADVIRGKVKVPAFGPYSLENNLMVVGILDAARESARTGKAAPFKTAP